MAQTTGEHGQVLVNLRELLAEQTSAMQAEHARIGEKIESIVDIVGMVGETVHHIAAVALQPKASSFGALPTRPTNTAATSVTDRPMQVSPQPAVTAAPRILPARPPVQQPSPQPATAVAAVVAVQPPVEQPASTTVASHVTAQPTATGASPAVEHASPPLRAPDVTATQPRLVAVPARGEPDPAPAEPSNQAPRSTATGRGATASAGGSTLSRSLGFTPAAAEILTLTSSPSPRQLRAEAAARERSRLDDALSDLTLDDSAEPGDAPDASEAPHV